MTPHFLEAFRQHWADRSVDETKAPWETPPPLFPFLSYPLLVSLVSHLPHLWTSKAFPSKTHILRRLCYFSACLKIYIHIVFVSALSLPMLEAMDWKTSLYHCTAAVPQRTSWDVPLSCYWGPHLRPAAPHAQVSPLLSLCPHMLHYSQTSYTEVTGWTL